MDILPVEVESPPAGPLLCLQQGLLVHLGGVWLGQRQLHHIREWSLFQLVAVQGQELLELAAHLAALGEGGPDSTFTQRAFVRSDILVVFSPCSRSLPRSASYQKRMSTCGCTFSEHLTYGGHAALFIYFYVRP